MSSTSSRKSRSASEMTPIGKGAAKRARIQGKMQFQTQQDHQTSATLAADRRLARSYRMSRLESLPTELLEHIFLETFDYFALCPEKAALQDFDINLICASPLIAVKLSSSTVFDKVLQRIIDGIDYGSTQFSLKASSNMDSFRDHVHCLNEVLKCRWLTSERFEQFAGSIDKRAQLNLLHVTDNHASNAILRRNMISIPQRLVKKRSTPDERALLDHLVRLGCVVRPDSMAAEEASQSLANAVGMKNYCSAFRLAGAGVQAHCSQEVVEAFKSIDCDPWMLRLLHLAYELTEFSYDNSGLKRLRTLAFARYRRGSAEYEIATEDLDLLAESGQDIIGAWSGLPCQADESCLCRGVCEIKSLGTSGLHGHWKGRWYTKGELMEAGYVGPSGASELLGENTTIVYDMWNDKK